MRFARIYLLGVTLFATTFLYSQSPINVLNSILTLSSHNPAYNHTTISKSTDLVSPLGAIAHSIRSNSYAYKVDQRDKKGLWVRYMDSLYKYEAQQLFALVDGTVSKKELKDLGKELKRTLKMLNRLTTGSEYAKNIINTLQQSENQFVIDIAERTACYILLPLPKGKKGMLNNNAYAFQIIERDQLIVDYAPFNQIGCGAEIRWNPKLGMIKLAHELGHAYDVNYGLLDDRLIRVYRNFVPAREVRAIYHENRIRKELSMELRTRLKDASMMIIDGEPITYPLPLAARK